MTMIGKDCPTRANAFCLSSEKRDSSAAMSPAETLCFDIFSPPPGDSDVISQVDRLSSNETKIAPRSVRIAVGAWGRSVMICMVASRVGGSATSLCQSVGRYPLPMGSLLIDRKHQRLLRRIDVKADDVLDLRDEVGIVGDLETAHEMRLEAVFGPDALHARVADAHFFRHRSHAPVCGIGGTLLHGPLDDLELHSSAERLSARRLGAAFDQTIDAGLGKIVLPAPDGGLRNPDLTHNRHDAMTVRRHQHDPRSLGDLLSRVSIGEQLLQFPASLAIKCNQVVSHAASESGSRQVGIERSVTETLVAALTLTLQSEYP